MADLDHRAHARSMAAALGVAVDIEPRTSGLLTVLVMRGGAWTQVDTNATEARNAWRWAAEHLARETGGGEAFAAARRDYQDAARAEFEGRAEARTEDRVSP